MNRVQDAPTDRLSTPKSRRRGWRWGIVLLGLAGLSIIALFSIQVFGRVYGLEFSPHTFQRRYFHYYELPLLQIQITPIHRSDWTKSLELQLVSDGLVGSDNSPELRWDLDWAQPGARSLVLGDANILCEYLDSRDANGRLRWQEWTDRNPELAKSLWATVERLAIEKLYLLVPDVFALADRAADAAEFQQAIAETLGDRFELLARTQIELGDRPSAIGLAKQGRLFAQDHGFLRELAEQNSDRASDP